MSFSLSFYHYAYFPISPPLFVVSFFLYCLFSLPPSLSISYFWNRDNMCWRVCDYWQEGSLTFQRRVTGFAEKHFTSPHRAVASGFSASPSSSKLPIFHTCISWHNLSRLPFLLTSSIPEIEVIPQPLGSPLLPSFTWRGLFIRRFCEFGFGFWRDAALYDPWRPSFTSRHWTLFLTLSAVSFLSIFSLLLHFCFLNLLCFWPLVSPHLYFCFVATFFFLIVFLRTWWMYFCWAFSFSCLFPFFLLCISLFSCLEIISLFSPKIC